MSIYATLWEIRIRRPGTDEWPLVYAQSVPAHIGQPSEGYESDPYADFLPPIVTPYDSSVDAMPYRAVVIVQQGHHGKEGQRYVELLAVYSGQEYDDLTIDELFCTIRKRLRPMREDETCSN